MFRSQFFSTLCLLLLSTAAVCAGCSSSEKENDDDVAGDEAAFSIFPSRPPPPLGPTPQGKNAQYPIILIHGFNGSPEMLGFHRVKEALEADGHVVFEARLPPFNSPEVRARYLARQVDSVLATHGAKKVNLIGHSMGGLDSRVLVSANGLGYGDRVASVTTIATPHRGTWPADLALGVPGEGGPHQVALDFFASVWASRFTDADLAKDTDMHAAIAAIAERNAAAFNAKYVDDQRVSYRSWAGVSALFGIGDKSKDTKACDGKLLSTDPEHPKSDHLNLALAAVAVLVAHGTEGRANDGAVTVESAKWGTFGGCIPADHFDEVGQMHHDRPDEHTGFDHIRFYRNLAFDLSRSGF